MKIHKAPASAPLLGVAGTALSAALERLWNGKWYFPALFFLAAGLAAAGGMAGPLVFAGLICLFLVFCSDLLAAVFPFLLLCLLTVDHFDNYRAFLPYWWVLPLVAAAFIYHLSVYAKPFRAGRNFRPLALVTAATLLGGLGNLTMKDFLSPVSLYYTLGLGVGMLAVYMIAKTQLTADRSYDVLERFGTILYGAGLFAGFMVLRFYCMNLREFLQTLSTEFFSYRNYMATVMLMALPVPFYQSLRRCRHLAGAAVLYLCLLLTGSRSGMLFGTLLMAAGTVYLLHYDRRRRKKYILVLALAAVPLVLLDAALIRMLFSSRIADGTFHIEEGDSRILFFQQALRDFTDNPLFGQGIGNSKNGAIYKGVPGSMIWYHNWGAQVLGSMGLTGVAAYGAQLRARMKTVRAAWCPLAAALGLSYVGIFLMSMTNPGEFCPLPNEFLVVILFTLMEDREKRPDAAALPSVPHLGPPLAERPVPVSAAAVKKRQFGNN